MSNSVNNITLPKNNKVLHIDLDHESPGYRMQIFTCPQTGKRKRALLWDLDNPMYPDKRKALHRRLAWKYGGIRSLLRHEFNKPCFNNVRLRGVHDSHVTITFSRDYPLQFAWQCDAPNGLPSDNASKLIADEKELLLNSDGRFNWFRYTWCKGLIGLMQMGKVIVLRLSH